MIEAQPIRVEQGGDKGVTIVHLERPKALNALNGALLDQLDAALDAVSADPVARVVVVTGGKNFCAGADLKEELSDTAARIRRMHALALRLRDLPVTTIAAIEGWALGGGLELAMACTFRVAAPSARLGLPEIHLGAMPSYGGTQLAARLIGPARALELICDGNPIDAATAHRIGLVNWLSDGEGDALPFALKKAAELAAKPLNAIRAAREAIALGVEMPLADGLALEARIAAQWHGGDGLPPGVLEFRKDRSREP